MKEKFIEDLTIKQIAKEIKKETGSKKDVFIESIKIDKDIYFETDKDGNRVENTDFQKVQIEFFVSGLPLTYSGEFAWYIYRNVLLDISTVCFVTI